MLDKINSDFLHIIHIYICAILYDLPCSPFEKIMNFYIKFSEHIPNNIILEQCILLGSSKISILTFNHKRFDIIIKGDHILIYDISDDRHIKIPYENFGFYKKMNLNDIIDKMVVINCN